MENAPLNHLVFTYESTDATDHKNIFTPVGSTGPFSFDGNNEEIFKVTGPLDFETNQQYIFQNI